MSSLEKEKGLLGISGDRGLIAIANRSSSVVSGLVMKSMLATEDDVCCLRIDSGGPWGTMRRIDGAADLGDAGPGRKELKDE
jgi:hypothetical protein